MRNVPTACLASLSPSTARARARARSSAARPRSGVSASSTASKRVELEHQGAQAVRQDVVDLPGRIGPLGQGGGPGVLLPGPFGVGQAQLRLLGPQRVLPPAGRGQEAHDGHRTHADVAGPLAGGQDAEGRGHHGQGGDHAARAEAEAGRRH